MARLNSLAGYAVITWFVIAFALRAGWLPAWFPAPLVFAVAAVGILAGLVLVLADAWSGFRKMLPSAAQRNEVAAHATQLGLRSLRRDRTSLDLSFPFLQPPASSTWLVLRRALGALVVTFWALYAFFVLLIPGVEATARVALIGGSAIFVALVVFFLADIRGWRHGRSQRRNTPTGFAANFIRPRAAGFDQIFTGTWNDLDVCVFDYWSMFGNTRQEWTCAVMPIDPESPEIQITRRPIGRVQLFGLVEAVDSDEESLRILSDRESAAQRFIDGQVRSQLVADKIAWELIHLRKRRMLYCGDRQPLEARGALLEAANRLRAVLPAG